MHLGKKFLTCMLLGLGLNMIASTAEAQSKKAVVSKKSTSTKKTITTKTKVTKLTRASSVSETTKRRVTSRVSIKKSARDNTIKIARARGGYTPSASVIYSVYDISASKYLEKSNINSTHSIASLTKLMSSYVFLKNTPSLENCNIQITEEDRDTLKNTRSHLPKNQDINCNKILEATLALSDNYAASSLSRNVPNFSRAEFVKKMNEQAKKWNMSNTYFADPSGLNPQNRSTANDLTKFLSQIVATKEFKIMDGFSTSKSFLLPTAGKPRFFSNTNRLIREETFDAVLSKTGYISESGYNLMFMPKNCANNKQLALVIMGERTSYNRSSLAKKLLNKYDCK